MGRGGSWRTAAVVVLVVVGALLVVLVCTGLWLVFRYVPNQGSPPLVSMRGAHRFAAQLLLSAIGALVVVGFVGFAGRRGVVVGLAALSVALAVVASVTGFLLPWDQIAISTVTVLAGLDGTGYETILHDGDVKYVLLGGSAVGSQAIARWFWVHTTVIPTLLVATLVACAIVTRRRMRTDDPTTSAAQVEHVM